MSIIAYFLHLDEAQLQAVRQQPALVWSAKGDPRFVSAKLIDLDKDYEVLAWLLSPKKRLEQAQQLARYKAIDRETEEKADYSKADFERVVEGELKKLGVSGDDPNRLPTDPLLEALEGRGTEAQREPRVNFGLGNARLFTPTEVRRLSEALAGVGATQLRAAFDRTIMAKFDVGGMDWLSERDAVFDDFLAPAFYKIRSFYIDASKLGHHVLVIYQ
ncbi:MAG: DUF1877 family protein [Inhella sp.]